VGRARTRSRSIGHITHGAKQTGERRTGNPFAPFDEAGAGDGPMRAPRQSSTLRVVRRPSTMTSRIYMGSLLAFALALAGMRFNTGAE
jgi:hypothetical protein